MPLNDGTLQLIVADLAVDIVDIFHMGRFDASKTRPILVKLRVGCDRRLITN
jgi:hypothetical protein